MDLLRKLLTPKERSAEDHSDLSTKRQDSLPTEPEKAKHSLQKTSVP